MTTVLVVDDSASDRRLVGGLIGEHSGINVIYAHDGEEALAKLRETTPALVVTDMQMPRIDGLQLVRTMRNEHPEIPVVLITGRGSEEIAVTALRSGATSYVPKSALARDLVPTIMNVLSVARANESHSRMLTCLTSNVFQVELENDYTLIGPLVNMVREIAQGMGICDETGRFQMGVALEAALSNAVYHGNLELTSDQLEELSYDLYHADAPNIVEQRQLLSPYRERRVYVDARFTRAEARIVIRDEGPGFDPTTIPEPGDMVTADCAGGRGITHMRLFMDEVQFNDRGNEVTLVKRRMIA